MANRIIAGLLAASLATPAFAQTAPPPATEAATTVAPVTVTRRREPPAEMLPDVTTCLAATEDPITAGAMAGGADLRFYVKTRLPRNPDYNAPPRTPPGSPLPDVMSLDEFQKYARQFRDLADLDEVADVGMAGADLGEEGGAFAGGGGSSRLAAMSKCLDATADALAKSPSGPINAISSNGSESSLPQSGSGGRMSILLRDKTVPLAYTLFEDGRYEEALVQFKAANGKMDNREAALMIGKIYLFGLKEKSDPVEAVRWLKMAAEAKFDAWHQTPVFDPREPERNTAMGEAAMILSDIYRDGRGPIPKDPEKSRKYLQLAYDVGHIAAAKLLGDIYYEGTDTPRDLKRAFKAYMDAAKFAYVPAMNAVAQMYDAGEVDGRPNPQKALVWRNEAAKADDPAALYALAVAYDRGDGVDADPDRALALYKLAAMNDAPAAMTALGTYFYRGEAGLPSDPVTARRWFQQAAMERDTDGMFNLAAMMAKGEGGELDRVRAWGWLKIAARAGHPNAAAAARALETQFTSADRAGVERLSEDGGAVGQDAAPATDPEGAIDAEFVGTAPGGPPWWKVSKGGATVWVLGLPAGRTLERQRWNTDPLRRTLSGARLTLGPYSPWADVKLEFSAWSPLPDTLGQRVAAAAVNVRMPLRNRRPTLSDALATRLAFYHRDHLIDSPPIDLYRVALAKRVTVARPPARHSPPLLSLDPTGPGVAACVEAILDDIDQPVAASQAAGEAWAKGDVAGALSAPRGAEWGCRVLWPDHWQRSVGFQTEAIAMALDMPGKVVAAIDIGQLVAKDGILPRLRAMGLEVSGPMQPTGQ